MKSVLRSQSLGFTALAAIALSLSACSGEPGAELDTSDSFGGDDSAQVRQEGSSKAERAGGETAARDAQPPARAERPRPTATTDEETPRETSANPTPALEPSAEQTAPGAEQTPPAPVQTKTMRVSGNRLLDACGQPFVVRGVEQIFGEQLPQGNDWLGLLRQIAATGANAVRILPGVDTLSVGDVDELLTFVGEQDMVAFIDPLNGGDWYARDDVRAMLKKHERFLIIDAYGEPQYDDLQKWRAEAKQALVRMRGLGYEVPFTVYANQYGRGLPSLFDYGAEILAADPLQNTFLGWQAYWGNNGYYQEHYGYTLEEAVAAIVDSGLPIQLGLDHITDLPSTEADYGTLMQGAEANGIGWLWWDFYNPYGRDNNLSKDGSADNLTVTGRDVLDSHDASVANTARRACGR